MRDLRSIELASFSPWQSALHHIRQQKSRAGFWRFSGSSFGYRWQIANCCCSPGKSLLAQWCGLVEQLGPGIVSWMWLSLLTKCAKCGCSPSGRLYSVVWKQMVNQGKVSASKEVPHLLLTSLFWRRMLLLFRGPMTVKSCECWSCNLLAIFSFSLFFSSSSRALLLAANRWM